MNRHEAGMNSADVTALKPFIPAQTQSIFPLALFGAWREIESRAKPVV
jgi:hypothetical protein